MVEYTVVNLDLFCGHKFILFNIKYFVLNNDHLCFKGWITEKISKKGGDIKNLPYINFNIDLKIVTTN